MVSGVCPVGSARKSVTGSRKNIKKQILDIKGVKNVTSDCQGEIFNGKRFKSFSMARPNIVAIMIPRAPLKIEPKIIPARIVMRRGMPSLVKSHLMRLPSDRVIRSMLIIADSP
jgi:hypothetical protein